MRHRWLVWVVVLLLLGVASAAGNKVGPARCIITWTASVETPEAPVEVYRIYIRRPGKPTYDTEPWLVVPKTITSTPCPRLEVDGQYYIIVRAANSAGESPDSNVAPFVYDRTPPARIE